MVPYKAIRIYNETVKVSLFLTKPFSTVRNLKIGLAGEGSSGGHTGRTFKGFVHLKTRFLKFWTLLDFSETFLRGSVKTRLF